MGDRRRYWAFLSYSHTDRAWADRLHRGLETYAVPGRLVGRGTRMGPAPRRFQPVFRDRAELTADADLRARVRDALEQSAFLIVICSPAAARSPWVEDEIVRFKILHGEAPVLAIIVAGAPRASSVPGREDQECFPPALRVRVAPDGALTGERADPIAADVRPGGDGRRLAMLKLLARMLDVGLDDLVQRDLQRRQGRLAALAGVSMAGAVAMGGLAAFALISRDEARSQRSQAEGLVAFMLGDLRKKLEPFGRLDVLDSVGTRAMKYYSSQERGGLDDKALGQRASVLHLLGDIQEKRGNLAAALKDFQQASTDTALLLARKPGDGERIFNHAQSVFYVGDVAYQRGESQRALRQFLEYKRLAERLVAIDPANADWQGEIAYANSNLGTALLTENRAEEALAAFRRAIAIDQMLALKSPRDRERRMNLAQAFAWASDAEAAAGRDDPALKDRLAERSIYDVLLGEDPNDNAASEDLVVNRVTIGGLLMRAGRSSPAISEFETSAREAERLKAIDPANTRYQLHAATAFTALGRALLVRHSLPAAAMAADHAQTLNETLVAKDPTVDEWRGVRLGSVRLLRIKISAEAARSPSACRRALAPAVEEAQRLDRLSIDRPRDEPLALAAAEASLLSGDYQAISARIDGARAAWAKALAIIRDVVSHGSAQSNDRGRAVRAQVHYRANQLAVATVAASRADRCPYDYAW